MMREANYPVPLQPPLYLRDPALIASQLGQQVADIRPVIVIGLQVSDRYGDIHPVIVIGLQVNPGGSRAP